MPLANISEEERDLGSNRVTILITYLAGVRQVLSTFFPCIYYLILLLQPKDMGIVFIVFISTFTYERNKIQVYLKTFF